MGEGSIEVLTEGPRAVLLEWLRPHLKRGPITKLHTLSLQAVRSTGYSSGHDDRMQVESHTWG